MGSNNGQQLVSRLLSEADEDGSLALALLNTIHSGYPIDHLRELLHSDSGVKAGTWILSELGATGRTLIDEIPALLDHDSAYVRSFAIDALSSMARPEDGPFVAKAVALIADTNPAVRSKALQLLAAGPLDALQAASAFLLDDYRARTSWLVTRGTDPENIDEVLALIQGDDVLWRGFAVAAATRLAGHTERGLEVAAQSADPDVRRFATLELAVRSIERRP